MEASRPQTTWGFLVLDYLFTSTRNCSSMLNLRLLNQEADIQVKSTILTIYKHHTFEWKVPYFPVANTALIPRRGNRRNCIQILNWISVFWHDNYNRKILSQFRQYHRHYGGHWWRRMTQSAWSMKASWEFVMTPNIHVSICISLLKSIHSPPSMDGLEEGVSEC